MTRLMLAVLLTAFAIGPAAAQAPGTCESRAVWKDGKALHGAAKKQLRGEMQAGGLRAQGRWIRW
jgi:hypothetical protein